MFILPDVRGLSGAVPLHRGLLSNIVTCNQLAFLLANETVWVKSIL